MSHQELQDLCPVYAVGALDGEELRELEAHLTSGCPICQQEIQEYRQLLTALAGTLPSRELSPSLKSQLMAQIERRSLDRNVVKLPASGPSPGETKRTQAFAWLPWTCALAAGMAFVVSLWNLSTLKRDLSEHQVQLAQQQEQLLQLRSQLEKERTVTAFLSDPEVRVTMLAGTEKDPKAAGKILWNPKEKRALFYASHLPVPPSGKTYQLWIIAQNQPYDAGIFSVDPEGNGFLKIEVLSEADKAQKFAVTLEPAGGVSKPTGEMHLLGSL